MEGGLCDIKYGTRGGNISLAITCVAHETENYDVIHLFFGRSNFRDPYLTTSRVERSSHEISPKKLTEQKGDRKSSRPSV